MADILFTPPRQSQIVNLGFLYASGCQIQVSTPTEITISPGQMRDQTNTFDIKIKETLTVSLNFNGAGGIDTGSVIDDGFYAVYVLYDYTQRNLPCGLLSLVSKNPLMPQVNNTYYSHYRLIGYVRVLGAVFDEFRILGNSNDRQFIYNTEKGVLFNGTANSYTPVSLATEVPSIIATSDTYQPSLTIDLNILFTPFVAGSVVALQSGLGLGSGATVFLTGVVDAVTQVSQVICVADYVDPDYVVNYAVTTVGDDVTIGLPSFKYSI